LNPEAVELLLERFEQPAHRGRLPAPAVSATQTNPRCGDVVTMYADVQAGTLRQVLFDGGGCTISQAAADLVAEMAEGRLLSDVAGLRVDDVLNGLGRDVVGTRLDCASLGLRSLQQAIAAA
jgi:nitrogen fixation protein NifU and related proteins